MENLIMEVVNRANRYLRELETRRVSPSAEAILGLKHLDVPLQDYPIEPAAVLAELDDIGSGATVASAGSRYFGFVTGGALPATMAANMLAAVWDQNAVLETASPVASFIEEVCRKWLVFVREVRHLLVAMRISVSSWATTGEDVDKSLEAMLRIAKAETGE